MPPIDPSMGMPSVKKFGLPNLASLLPSMPSGALAIEFALPSFDTSMDTPKVKKFGLPSLASLLPSMPAAAVPFALPEPPCPI